MVVVSVDAAHGHLTGKLGASQQVRLACLLFTFEGCILNAAACLILPLAVSSFLLPVRCFLPSFRPSCLTVQVNYLLLLSNNHHQSCLSLSLNLLEIGNNNNNNNFLLANSFCHQLLLLAANKRERKTRLKVGSRAEPGKRRYLSSPISRLTRTIYPVLLVAHQRVRDTSMSLLASTFAFTGRIVTVRVGFAVVVAAVAVAKHKAYLCSTLSILLSIHARRLRNSASQSASQSASLPALIDSSL